MKHSFNIYEDADLLKKQLTEEATEEEKFQAEQLLTQHPDLKEEVEKLHKKGFLKSSFQSRTQFSSTEAYQRFIQKTHPHPQHRRYNIRWWHSVAAVAVILIGIFASGILTPKQKETLAILAPGEQKGMLELIDGKKIGVEKQEISIVEGDIQVDYKQGVLSYTPAKQQPIHRETEETETTEYNKFVIPRGGENTVILSDGTTVRLNSDSKLTYPVRFKGKQRIVMLEGEAFFDVAKDTEHPFIVRTRYGEVSVLGTAFNINAYKENEACYTTLVRGKVRVTTLMDDFQELLPGEQAVVWIDKIEKRTVDVDDYVGWVKGIFSFHNETLGNIMSTLERWYNIEIIYEDPSLAQLTYTGAVKRYENINSFLDAFELTGDLSYQIKNRKIYIFHSTE